MLACADPAVDPAARTPLMLQAVLGLSAERMASAFLSSPAAMTKRLVRAKARIAASGTHFCLPGREALSERINPLLDAIYAAFTLGRDSRGDGALESEAFWLSSLLAELAPDEPEAAGLLSLILFVSSRSSADAGDGFTPLSQQDPATWNSTQIAEAEERLRAAGYLRRPGRFQFEAAIQAVHADRRRSGRTDWAAILTLYDGLLAMAPTIGAKIARAAALAQSGNATAALAALDALEPVRIAAHQPYWATRAFVLAASGEFAPAADAYLRAAGLTEHRSIRVWLLEQRAALAS
jgi:RNA polymerase sigma-70 factor (ECF subfamily)